MYQAEFETSNDLQKNIEPDVFYKDYKFYKLLKQFEAEKHPQVLQLDRVNSSNIDHLNLKVKSPKTKMFNAFQNKNYMLS